MRLYDLSGVADQFKVNMKGRCWDSRPQPCQKTVHGVDEDALLTQWYRHWHASLAEQIADCVEFREHRVSRTPPDGRNRGESRTDGNVRDRHEPRLSPVKRERDDVCALTPTPFSSSHVELNGEPSECKKVIVPRAGLPVALLKKIVVLHEPPVKLPTATCGK